MSDLRTVDGQNRLVAASVKGIHLLKMVAGPGRRPPHPLSTPLLESVCLPTGLLVEGLARPLAWVSSSPVAPLHVPHERTCKRAGPACVKGEDEVYDAWNCVSSWPLSESRWHKRGLACYTCLCQRAEAGKKNLCDVVLSSIHPIRSGR